MITQKPKNQRRWKHSELEKAVKLFMSGMSYEEVSKHVPFHAQAVQNKLNKQGFSIEYRDSQLVRAVNQ